MPNNNIDKRKEERYPVCKKVKYVLCGSSGETFQCLVTNISRSGMCLHVYKTLDKGECITLRSDLKNSCRKAVLKWISEIDNGLYMAGFICL